MNDIERDILRKLNLPGGSEEDIICAFRVGKQLFDKLFVKTTLKSESEINGYLEFHKQLFGEDLIEVILLDEANANIFGFIKFEFYPNISRYFKDRSSLSDQFKEFLLSQNIKERLLSQIQLPDLVKKKHFLLQIQGVYYDDEFGAIDTVIYGAKTRIILRWSAKSNKKNIYPSHTDFNPNDIIFEVPKFDSTAFVDYVKSIKKRPKYFKDLNVSYKIREKMYTYGEDFLELKINLSHKDDNIVQKMIEKIKDFINKRISASEIEEHMKEEYFRYFNFKDIKADSFTFDLDLGTGDIQELYSIFYLLDETDDIKSISVTLK